MQEQSKILPFECEFILKLFYFANKISLIFSEVKNKINKYVLQTQAVLVNKFKNISKEMHWFHS